MHYSKNQQQTISTQYHDVSFTNHTPLKSSNIINSSLLDDSNLYSHFRNSSIQSIKSPKNSRHIAPKSQFQNEIIRSHPSWSQQCLKNISLDNEIKRSAYLFFNKQKSKILAASKSCKYLLPKICLKSKKAYKSINSEGAQNQKIGQFKNKKQLSKKKLQKMQIRKKSKLNIQDWTKQKYPIKQRDLIRQLGDENSVAELTKKFRLRCQAELDKISLKIPESFRREKCFFDLTHQQIQQIYVASQVPQQTQQSDREKENNTENKKRKKFNLVRIDSDSSGVEQNQSVPLFLMQRISAKDVVRSCNNSFLTDVPRVQNKLPRKPKLRHIL